MARWSMASYNRFLGASMQVNGFSRREAAQHYREMRKHLDRPVFRTDLDRHPRISQKEANKVKATRIPRKGPRIPPEELPPRMREKELEEGEELELDGSEDGVYD